jgi:hypothetical protein
MAKFFVLVTHIKTILQYIFIKWEFFLKITGEPQQGGGEACFLFAAFRTICCPCLPEIPQYGSSCSP